MIHFYQAVPGWFDYRTAYDILIDRAPPARPSIIVEVGCWLGRGVAYLGVAALNAGKPISVVAVDHFRGSAEHQGTRPEVEGMEARCRANLAPLAAVMGPRLIIAALPSADAAASFADRSCFAVWLDASHDEAAVRADIAAWLPKLEPGGYLGGDDCVPEWPGVERAVWAYFGDNWRRGERWWLARPGELP